MQRGVASRWVEKERNALTEMKEHLKEDLDQCPSFPEVHGDRRLLRFLRRNDYDIEKSCEKYRNLLAWRQEKKVDEIRESIVQGKLWHPRQFPKGDKIVPIAKGILALDGFLDVKGQPVSVEFYNYPPKEMSAVATVEDLIDFHIWCMEYKMLILEHMSNEMEIAKLEAGKCSEDGWGEVLQIFIIRDLGGFGRDHLGAHYRDMVARIMKLSGDYYPNCLFTCCFINTPFTFRFLYTAVKQFLPASSKKKIQFFSSNYFSELQRFIKPESLPVFMGGQNEIDWSSSSPIKEDINLTYIEDRFKLTPAIPSSRDAGYDSEDYDLHGDMTNTMVFDDLLPQPIVTKSVRSLGNISRSNSDSEMMISPSFCEKEDIIIQPRPYSFSKKEEEKGNGNSEPDEGEVTQSKSLKQKIRKGFSNAYTDSFMKKLPSTPKTLSMKAPRIPYLSDTGDYLSATYSANTASMKKKVKKMMGYERRNSKLSPRDSVSSSEFSEFKDNDKPSGEMHAPATNFITSRPSEDSEHERRKSQTNDSTENDQGSTLDHQDQNHRKKQLFQEILHVAVFLILFFFFARAVFLYREMASQSSEQLTSQPLKNILTEELQQE